MRISKGLVSETTEDRNDSYIKYDLVKSAFSDERGYRTQNDLKPHTYSLLLSWSVPYISPPDTVSYAVT